MKNSLLLLTLMVLAVSCNSAKKSTYLTTKNVLIFTKTNGFRHASIETGVAALREIAAENHWAVTHSEDSLIFTPERLKDTDLVIFLNTTGDIFGEAQEKAFKKYIEDGGRFFGIHAASDTEYDWPWYGDFIGGYFVSHPKIQQARINKKTDHVTVEAFPKTFERTDEWYNFKNLNPDVTVTLTLDESSYEGGKNGVYHPHAWYQQVGEGMMYYTGGGHTDESYSEPGFRQHLEDVMTWLMK
ncbi:MULTISPECIES: ThuA domain-containing protein [unclassified Leeuwenhoekiella]|uniref:ThuA domain-containing protein n=1 Tax=unclassified Leeuwenhoekiella TaxID=2615029 RepID=UPI000C356D1B|nr:MULTISPECIES: ThuA domain-containing protein [unclassified Leeuwenhoekiella]MAW96086.1 Crp/Fnr family transcriptional regulator [Leeuwenhoekiella sp.]MBA80080.1 Crp/Fnr family transcriptional regulator [Leeuwenhoekiella sp.]